MTSTQSLEGARILVFPHSRLTRNRRRAYRRFKEALKAFSDSPSTENAIHYLSASRALRPTGRADLEHGDSPPAA
jgi:hypothetical protein